MEPTFQLTPESALDAAASDNAPTESLSAAAPARSDLIERLDDLANSKELETIARAIDVSPQAIRSWLSRGVHPSEANRKRIEQFSNDTPPTDVAEESAKSGELFH